MPSTSGKSTLAWLRRNLRLEDNLVLKAALNRGGPVVPVFIWENDPTIGSASKGWLDCSLRKLQNEFLKKKSHLTIRMGDALKILMALAKETGADAVLWDKSFEPARQKADEAIRAKLGRAGIFCDAMNDSLLFDPKRVLTKQGTPFKVFTPFWNHCLSLEEPAPPVRLPAKLPGPPFWPRSEKLETLSLKADAKWTSKIEPFWQPGSAGALACLRKFLNQKVEHYPAGRDQPAAEGTSKLSPHLHFGEISVRAVWHETRKRMASDRRSGIIRASEAFLRQIMWREFAAHLLYHFPETISRPLRKEFLKFKWRKDARLFKTWQKGKTGYAIVDAGMRQLEATGWMHNRVRMIAASFLVKDLLQPWQDGAAWFMDTLVDADLANNTFGWQWVAGCGADAAPYFRIFNPVLQGKKFDPQGTYVRRWMPELSKVPAQFIHDLCLAPAKVLAEACIQLEKDYPKRIVDHHQARKRALFAYARMGKARL